MKVSSSFSALFLAVLAISSYGQPPSPGASQLRSAGALDSGSFAREIDDPASGARWVLLRNASHPGGPGRMILLSSSPVMSDDSNRTLRAYPLAPVIRGGDSVMLEDHTSVADTCLQGVALNPARLGGPIRARLALGGRIVSATATGPGRAVLVSDPEVWH